MKFKEIQIDPEMAKQMLSTMKANRKIKEYAVSRYAKDMSDGKWKLNPSPIVFFNGELIDGQHRLRAVIKSGVTVSFIVCENQSDIGDVIDSGVSRSAGDFLAINGIANANVKSAIVAKIMALKRGHESILSNQNRAGGHLKCDSRKAVQDFYFENQKTIDACARYAHMVYDKSSAHLLTTTEIGVLYFHFGMNEDAEKFLTSVYCGTDVQENTPAHALRRVLEDRKARLRVITSVDMFRYCQIAFEKFKNKESCARLILPKK